jgi:hypothetical protein
VSQGGRRTSAAQIKAIQLSEKHGNLSAGEGSARWTRIGRGGIRKSDWCLLSLSQSQVFEVSKDSAEDRIYPEDPLPRSCNSERGVRFGLLVAAVDEQSFLECPEVREKACSQLLVPSIRGLAREPDVDCTIVVIHVNTQRSNYGHSSMPFEG